MMGMIVGSLLRHGATALGGALLATGVVDESTAQAVGGCVVTVGGVLFSLAEKRLRG